MLRVCGCLKRKSCNKKIVTAIKFNKKILSLYYCHNSGIVMLLVPHGNKSTDYDCQLGDCSIDVGIFGETFQNFVGGLFKFLVNTFFSWKFLQSFLCSLNYWKFLAFSLETISLRWIANEKEESWVQFQMREGLQYETEYIAFGISACTGLRYFPKYEKRIIFLH